jgi:hypothetical protein
MGARQCSESPLSIQALDFVLTVKSSDGGKKNRPFTWQKGVFAVADRLFPTAKAPFRFLGIVNIIRYQPVLSGPSWRKLTEIGINKAAGSTQGRPRLGTHRVDQRQATRQHVVGESGVTSARRLSSKRWVTSSEARRSRSRRLEAAWGRKRPRNGARKLGQTL